ncbi:hypothetical protein K1719_006758 [Acacia pycnantha]|nr:hypothetical protein K1719_006758 [Acacia pycnantha]
MDSYHYAFIYTGPIEYCSPPPASPCFSSSILRACPIERRHKHLRRDCDYYAKWRNEKKEFRNVAKVVSLE